MGLIFVNIKHLRCEIGEWFYLSGEAMALKVNTKVNGKEIYIFIEKDLMQCYNSMTFQLCLFNLFGICM